MIKYYVLQLGDPYPYPYPYPYHTPTGTSEHGILRDGKWATQGNDTQAVGGRGAAYVSLEPLSGRRPIASPAPVLGENAVGPRPIPFGD